MEHLNPRRQTLQNAYLDFVRPYFRENVAQLLDAKTPDQSTTVYTHQLVSLWLGLEVTTLLQKTVASEAPHRLLCCRLSHETTQQLDPR